jgi:hypothetical protein
MARVARTPEPLDEAAARARFTAAFTLGAWTVPEGPRVGE